MEASIFALVYSPSGQQLATGTDTGLGKPPDKNVDSVRFWNPQTHKLLAAPLDGIDQGGNTYALGYINNGKYLLVGHYDKSGTLNVIDTSTFKVVDEVLANGFVASLAVDPTRPRFVVTSDHRLMIWDFVAKPELFTLWRLIMSGTATSTNTELSTATLLAAQTLSNMAYGSDLSQFYYDETYQTDQTTMAANGWEQISSSQVGGYVPETNYQGIAYYKLVNGQYEIIIANRGTCQSADLLRDVTIALGGDPDSDRSALNYYNAVAGWAGRLGKPFNIVETGHSLGGQEADYVMAAAGTKTLPAPEAITFDAPGIGPEATKSTNAPDAVNLYNAGDLVLLERDS